MYNEGMKLFRLSEKMTASPQLEIKDLNKLKKNGADIVVCNRPDNESPEQVQFIDIATAAELLGITPIEISFKPDEQTLKDVIAFEELLYSNRKVHAYCRTANRSISLWAAASVKAGSRPDQILKIAGIHGIHVFNAIAPYLKDSSLRKL